MGSWNKPRVIERFEAEELIKRAIDKHKPNIYVAFSGGKSSLVALYIARKIWKDIPVMFCNTGVEFPETVEFVRKLVCDWDLNYIETQPYKKTFWDCVNEYGVPSIKASKKGKSRPKCCYYLKERPAEIKCKEFGLRAVITGIQGSESYTRRRVIMFCGQRYLHKKTGVWRYHPLAFWSDQDIWDYIKNNNIPYNPAYDKYPNCNRTGCLPCTSYKNWRVKLREQNPKMLAVLDRKMAEQGMRKWEGF